MFKKAVFPGRYVQGEGALGELPAMLKIFGKRGMVLASNSVIKNVLPSSGLVPAERGILVEPFGGECCEEELTRISGIIEERRVDVVVGMGGERPSTRRR